MSTITISRQFGSCGDEIARRVCEILDYRYFDKNLIVEAAKASGLSEQEIVDYSEENYKVRTFLDSLLGRPPHVTEVHVWKEDLNGVRVSKELKLDEEATLLLVQNAILYAHSQGSVVILGRGGQAVLKDKAGVLHVRIEAPLEHRIARIKEQIRQAKHAYDATIDLRREAQDLITQKDIASADYVRHFYGVDWADPACYHLILNTGKLEVEQAAQVIAKAANEIFVAHVTGEMVMA